MFNQIPAVFAGLQKVYQGASSSGVVGSSFGFGANFGVADPERRIIVASAFGGSNAAPTSCVVGGISATLLAGNSLTRRAQLWMAAVPTGTSGTVSVSGSNASGSGIHVWAVYPIPPIVTGVSNVSGAGLAILGSGFGVGAGFDTGISMPNVAFGGGFSDEATVTWVSAGLNCRLTVGSTQNIDATINPTVSGSSGGPFGFAAASLGV